MPTELKVKAGAGIQIVEDGTEITFSAAPITSAPIVAGVVLTAGDNGRVLSNEGAAGAASTRPITLPSAAAGMSFPVIDHNGSGIRIVAAAGDTIRIGNQVSKVAGYIQSASQWAKLELKAINATEWVAFFVEPDWDVETA